MTEPKKKKAKPISPTQLTLRHMREAGYLAAVVEHWNPHARIRQDLFGILDVVAVGNGQTVGIQCTTYKNMASRVTKIAESEALPELRKAGWRLLVMGWHKKDNRWTAREVDVS